MRNKVWQGFSGVRLICGTADRGTAGPAEPKEMAVLLQLPLANVLKWLVAINFYNNWAISHPLIGRELLSITVQTIENFCRFWFSITERALVPKQKGMESWTSGFLLVVGGKREG